MIVCSTSLYSVGCTFLDWSINFLSGQSQHYHYIHGWGELVDNPVGANNAHQHSKNHPHGFIETKKVLDILSDKNFATLYPAPLAFADAVVVSGPEHADLVNQTILNDYQDTLKLLHTKTKVIFVDLDPSCSLYRLGIRSKRKLLTNTESDDPIEIRKDLESTYYKDTIADWEALGLTEIWDVRERLALSTRPLELPMTAPHSNLYHMAIDARSLWFNGYETCANILSWLELPLSSSRLGHWQLIYKDWQAQQLKELQFQFEYQKIVDAIVHNLPYYINLTFDQEVVIQHCLIYQHNLNFKTWNLTKFPNNTKDLHQLLETNFHNLSSY